MINTTRLIRRIERFEQGGGFATHIGRDVGYGLGLVQHIRKGRTIKDDTLRSVDKYLSERGF